MESQVIVYITDKSKTKMFKNYISELYIDSAKRDLQKHLNDAKKNSKMYHFLDIETAEIKVKYLNKTKKQL